MNYKELKAKASKGPFEVSEMFGSVYVLKDDTHALCSLPVHCGSKVEDAQLIAHTLNTYDALLEALEEVSDYAKRHAETAGSLLPQGKGKIDRMFKALKAAQTVEVGS